MKRMILLLVALLLAGAQTLSAQRTITGTIISADDNMSVPGASVSVRGTTIGTVTDMNGRFSINVPADATHLVVSFMGMESQEVEIAGRTTIDVRMRSDAIGLEGIIVTAYGTVRRESFTGSAAQVTGATLQERTQSNIGTALQGVLPGVQIASASGQPGSEATIRVRGIGSMTASSAPLIIVDGVPYTGPLSSINMNDVETLTVLKDAAATSMYGARGANGVVLITTRRGRAGQTRVHFDARVGFNQRGVPEYDVVTDPREFMSLAWEALHNSNAAGQSGDRGLWASNNLLTTTQAQNFAFEGDHLINPDGTFNPTARVLFQDNWLDAVSQIGVRQEYTASVSGGSETTRAFLGLGFVDDNSYVMNSNFRRYSARLNIDHRINRWFRTGMSLSYSKRISNTLQGDPSPGALQNIWLFGQRIAPIYSIWQRDEDGNFILDANGNRQYQFGGRAWGGLNNPVATQAADIRRNDIDRFFGSTYLTVDFWNDFTFTANLTVQNSNAYNILLATPIGGDALAVNGRGVHTSTKGFNINTQQLLTWERSFGVHNFNVLLGHEYSHDRFKASQFHRTNFFNPANPMLGNATGDITLGYSYQTDLSYDSYFTRVLYDFGSRYHFSASFRRDASSRFHPDHRWGNFWAVGAAWRLDQEDFMRPFTFVNLLTFRASYGIQGNDNIIFSDPRNWRHGMSMHNVFNSQYDVVDVGGEMSLELVYRGAADLTWETSHNFNIGFSFALFNRLSGSIEYYNRRTEDMLFRRPLPQTAGHPDWRFENVMSMRNFGIEIDLSYDIVQTHDWTWTIGGNITTQTNELLSLPPGTPEQGWSPGGGRWYSVGGSIFQNYTLEFAGIDPKTGRPLFWSGLDIEGNVVLREPDGGIVEWVRTDNPGANGTHRILSDGLVRAFGGLRTNLRWRDFDFGITAFFQIGGMGSDGNFAGFAGNFHPGQTIHRDFVNNRWQNPGDLTNFPMLQHLPGQVEMGDRAFTSKSAFALQSITLGYSVPQEFLSRYGIENLRMFATVDNTALWSARQGFDPRISIGAGAGANFPDQRTYSLGLSLTF